jgi:hypothetical protein
MATENFNKLINIQVNTQSLGELNKQLDEIDKEIKEIQENEIKVNQSLEEQADALGKISKLEAQRNKISGEKEKIESKSLTQQEKTTRNLEAQQQKAEKLFKAAEGVGGAFQIAAGASLLLGDQTSEALEKAQAKVVAIIGVTDGVKKVAEGAAEGYKLISEGIKKSEVASKLFGTTTKAAIASTGIGLLLLALGAIVVYFDDITKAAKEFADSIGLTPIIDQVSEFVDSIGGIGGAITVAGGVIKGFFKEVINYFEIIGSFWKGLFTLDFASFKKNLSEVGSALKKETIDAVAKAQEEARFQRLLKEKEAAIKIKDQEIAIAKARGQETLKLEEENILARIELQKLRLSRLEKGSKEELELQEKLNAELVNLEANRKAQADKYFETRLKAVENQAQREIKIINDRDKTEVISSEEKALDLLLIEKKRLDAEIKLRKQHGEDVTALLTQQSQNALDIQAATSAERLSKIEFSNLEELKVLQDRYLNGELKEEEYQDKIAQLELKGLEDKLTTLEKGSKAELELITQINDKKIALNKSAADKKLEADKKAADREAELAAYLKQKAIDNEKAIVGNQKASIKERLDANEELYRLQTQKAVEAAEAAKKAYDGDSAAYQKALDEKKKAEEDFQKTRNQLIVDGVNQGLQVAQSAANALGAINDLVNAQAQAKIDESAARIAEIEEKNAEVEDTISNINEQAEESANRINELESGLADARGERSEILKQQLEDEKANRQGLLRQENEAVKKKIENEKKIEKEKQKIEKLEKERREREKILAITNAVINTALGVSQALSSSPPPLSFVLAGAVGVIGAAQIALIASQKYEDGGLLEGPLHSQGGIKGSGRFGNIEVEGGEFIVNRRSTQQYLPLLEAINGGGGSSKSSFADGGTLPNFSSISSATQTTNDAIREIVDRPTYVSVQEINDVGNRVKVIETSSEF